MTARGGRIAGMAGDLIRAPAPIGIALLIMVWLLVVLKGIGEGSLGFSAFGLGMFVIGSVYAVKWQKAQRRDAKRQRKKKPPSAH
jgi:hypothetical protein